MFIYKSVYKCFISSLYTSVETVKSEWEYFFYVGYTIIYNYYYLFH